MTLDTLIAPADEAVDDPLAPPAPVRRPRAWPDPARLATFVTLLALFGGWWLVSANGWFKGPVRQGTDEELERIEAQYGGAPAPAAPAVE